jgi:periplasmic divalent cation tolerance protein
MTEYIQVTTTTDAKEVAEGIARTLVEKRLAACVQVLGPLTSAYRWKGRVESAREWLCLIKSRKSLYAAMEKAIRKMHNYEVPEVIALPIVAGSKSYLKWLGHETGQQPRRR